MLPHRTAGAHRWGDDRSGNEHGQPSHESRLARADPRHHTRASPQIFRAPLGPFSLRAVGLGREQRVEPQELEVERSIDDPERFEEPADLRLRRDDQGVTRPLVPESAQGRNRQEHIAQSPGMDREGQGRSNASAASWRRPFVASAELE